jgi:hypothetical protein
MASVQIPLTQGKWATVDEEDAPFLAQYRWCTTMCGSGHVYAATTFWNPATKKARMVYMHRLLLDAAQGVQVDHENNNGLDNRRSNIRVATRSQNMGNQSPGSRNTSGYKGASFNRHYGKWLAQINCDKKHYFLGWHRDAESAARAYDAKARELFGPFARTNFPD